MPSRCQQLRDCFAAHGEAAAFALGLQLGVANVTVRTQINVVRRRQRMATTVSTTAAINVGGVVAISDLTFGVEFECLLPTGMSHAAAALRVSELSQLTVRSELYGHSSRDYWKVVTDGSLGDYARGAEFVSPVLSGEAGMQQVAAICRALTAIGAKVSRRCGYHVHVGARGQPVGFFQRLMTAYKHHEAGIDAVMPASRSNNHYCQTFQHPLLSVTDLNAFLQRCGSDRYRKINLHAYWRHGTVEFRQHSGTVDEAKAIAWLKFCLRLCAWARTNDAMPVEQSLAALLVVIGADSGEQAFFAGRAAHFARRNGGMRRAA